MDSFMLGISELPPWTFVLPLLIFLGHLPNDEELWTFFWPGIPQHYNRSFEDFYGLAAGNWDFKAKERLCGLGEAALLSLSPWAASFPSLMHSSSGSLNHWLLSHQPQLCGHRASICPLGSPWSLAPSSRLLPCSLLTPAPPQHHGLRIQAFSYWAGGHVPNLSRGLLGLQ